MNSAYNQPTPQCPFSVGDRVQLTANAIRVGIAGRNNRSTGTVLRVNYRDKKIRVRPDGLKTVSTYSIYYWINLTNPANTHHRTDPVNPPASHVAHAQQPFDFRACATLINRGHNLTGSEIRQLECYLNQVNLLIARTTGPRYADLCVLATDIQRSIDRASGVPALYITLLR